EVMLRYAVQSLVDRGVTQDRVYVSMERNMKCAVGFCGHCQMGGKFVCRDGPVFRFDKIAETYAIREL
ncbi:MAG: Ni/Fe hydrogenase subunit gamma, partial [Rhodospirillales bacterium]|nr:Ni/Fe hydrogenase subunit gamma [Rhodospirillales bacterium]